MDPNFMAYSAAQPYPDYPYELRPLPYHSPPPDIPPAGRPHPSNPPASFASEPAGFHRPYYLHHNPHPPPPPAVHVTPEQQKINTLFISGLPEDVKAREIHNLFHRYHGFVSCQLKYTGRGNQVVAFATFINHHSAMVAMAALNRTIFDPETRNTLYIELARSNSRKRPRGDAAYVIIDERAKVRKDNLDEWSDDGDVGSDDPSDTENDNSSKGALAATQSGKAESKVANGQVAVDSEKESQNIPPCSTLFIANLGPTCTEAQLKEVLSKFTGFHTLKMRGRSGMPVAFADFEDVESSTTAMNSLQDTVLNSSDRGLHIEYPTILEPKYSILFSLFDILYA